MKELLKNIVNYGFVIFAAIYLIYLAFFSVSPDVIYYASFSFACAAAFLQIDRTVWYKRYTSLTNSIEESDTHTYEYNGETTIELQELNNSESDSSNSE